MSGRVQIRLAMIAALAALVAVLGLTIVPALGTHASHPDISQLPNEGVLRLHTGDTGSPDDYFLFQEWDGTDYVDTSPVSQQEIGDGIRCELRAGQEVNGPLAAFAAVDGGNVGTFDNLYGIRVRGARGVDCSRVDATEGALSISLAADLDDLEVDYAEIDIEAKQNVTISAQAYLDGSAVGDPVEVVNCVVQDCGADSGGTDNFRVILAASTGTDVPPILGYGDTRIKGPFTVPLFDRIDLSVSSTSGEFSLGGGIENPAVGPLGDFLHTQDTLFHLTDVQVVNCDETVDVGDENLGGDYTFHNCDGFKVIVFVTNEETNEVEIIFVGGETMPPGEEEGDAAPYSLENWTFGPAPVDAVVVYNDGDGEFDAPFCLDDPRNSDGGLDDGLDPNDYLPLNSGPDVRHTTCKIMEKKTTVGQMDLGGDGSETALVAEVTFFSIADASRGFR